MGGKKEDGLALSKLKDEEMVKHSIKKSKSM